MQKVELIVENLSQSKLSKGKPFYCKHCHHRFNVDMKDKSKWISDKMICPSCGVDYCVLPKTERKLKFLQKDYIESGYRDREGALLYEALKIYIRSLILKHFTNVINDPEDILDLAHVASSKIFQMYLKKKNKFKIEVSFAQYSIFKIKESLWHKSEHIVGESLYEKIEDEKEHEKYGKKCKNINNIDILFSNFEKDCFNKILKDIRTKDHFLNLKILVSFNLFIKSGRNSSDKMFRFYGTFGKYKFIEALNLLKFSLENS